MGFLILGGLPSLANPSFVRFTTNLGNIDVLMLPGDAPGTVANFFNYVNAGDYANSVIHRSVLDFVIQGGGYTIIPSPLDLAEIPQGPQITNEYKDSNVRGTLAMAKLGSGPNTATSEWFFSDQDNSANLNKQNGGFTVFGVIINSASLAVMDTINNLPTTTLSSPKQGNIPDFPLYNYSSGTLTAANFVTISSISALTVTTFDFPSWQSVFFAGQSSSVSDPATVTQDDGVTNLMKYFCNITPLQTMSASDHAKLPKFTQTTLAGKPALTLTYHVRPNVVGVTGTVQTSTDLQSWVTPTNATTTQTAATDGTNETIVQVQVPVPNSGPEFIRLKVTQS